MPKLSGILVTQRNFLTGTAGIVVGDSCFGRGCLGEGSCLWVGLGEDIAFVGE